MHTLVQMTTCLLLNTVAALRLLLNRTVNGNEFWLASYRVICIVGLACILRNSARWVTLAKLWHLAVSFNLLVWNKCWLESCRVERHKRVRIGHVCLLTKLHVNLHLLEHLKLLKLLKLAKLVLLFWRHKRIMCWIHGCRIERHWVLRKTHTRLLA